MDKEIMPTEKGELDEAIDRIVDTVWQRLNTQVDHKFVPGDGEPEAAGKFKTFGEFLATVKHNPTDARLKAGLVEGTDTAGGFTVPDEFSRQILMRALEEAVIRRGGAFTIPMSSDTLNIPKVTDSAHTSTLFGGVVAYWTEEQGGKTLSQPTFGQIKLIAKKLTGYTYASDELLDDNAIGLEAMLMRMFGEAVAWYEDDAFINGSGVGQPLGILGSGALISNNRSAATTVAIADLANMWARLYPQSHSRAVWLANPSVLPQLVALASTTLTWMPMDQGLAKTPPATLLGKPVYFTEKCQALGTAGDIILADLGYYLIGDRQGLTIASSSHVRFTTDETAWRFVKRVDGQPWVDAVFTPAHGSTLSPFVTLHATTNGGN